MKKYDQVLRKNEHGLTLIEIVAALTIGTIVIGLAYSILINTTNVFKKTEGQQLLQQEANLILTQFRTTHTKHSTYTISFNESQNQYYITLSCGEAHALGRSEYNTVIIINGIQITSTNPVTIDAAIKQYQLSLQLSNPKINNEFHIETSLTRL